MSCLGAPMPPFCMLAAWMHALLGLPAAPPLGVQSGISLKPAWETCRTLAITMPDLVHPTHKSL